MADIAVSTLIRQIENHIQANRAAQALALCAHILSYFPKHLETYSLMAQALALQGNFDGALDVYRRVLSADPENAGAYAGIAHIFDFRHNWEEALWHMERAFELAPAQPAIRQELLRLYGQYESAPRKRLKFTRGALARLYAQEGLYDQAIHEFREIGSTSLSRYDIRVALAETIWRAGRTRDAAEVAQSLLDSLPYCLKANLILGTAWHESSIPESQDYLERAVALDPSGQVAQKMLGARSPLRVSTVMIPDYVEGAPPRAIQPAAREPEPAPLTVPLEESETLSIFETPEPIAPTPPPVAETTQEPPAQEIQTQPSTVAEAPRDIIATEPAPAASQDPKPSVIESELPPWLQSDAELPAEPAQEADAASSEAGGAGANPDWLIQLRRTFSDKPEEPTGIPAELIPVPTFAEKESPVEPSAEENPEVETTEPTPAPVTESHAETQDEDIPVWLNAQTEPTAEKDIEEETPAWLKEATASRAEISAPVAEPRVPKWVEVLSRRESEPDVIPPSESPTRSEPAAPAAQSAEPAPPAPTIAPALAPTPPQEVSKPEPALPVAEISEPSSVEAAEPPAPMTQVAEPEPPIVVETPPAETLQQPRTDRQPKYYEQLVQAREHRNAGRVSDALAEYELVINRAPWLVNEVILDLEALVATGDAPLDAHRLLGDAYSRAGRLNDALERYRYVKRAAEKNL